MEWIANHYQEIIVGALAVIGGASVAVKGIAKLTPNKTDDKIAAVLGKVQSFLAKIALNK